MAMTTSPDFDHHLAECERHWSRIIARSDPVDHAAAEKAISAIHALAGLPAPRFVWVPSPSAAYEAGFRLRLGKFAQAFRDAMPEPAAVQEPPPWMVEALSVLPCLDPDIRKSSMAGVSIESICKVLGSCRDEPHLAIINKLNNRRSKELDTIEMKSHYHRTPRHALYVDISTDSYNQACMKVGLDAGHDHGVLLPQWLAVTIGNGTMPYDEALINAMRGDVESQDDELEQAVLKALVICPFWIPLAELVLVSERPTTMSCDEQMRLHAEDGPAVAYEDCFCMYRWQGHPVDADFIASMKKLTPDRIDDEPHAERRRLMLEKYGVGRYLLESGAQVVDTDTVEVVRGAGISMPRCLIRDRQGQQYLEGTDGSTGRCYFMPVDPDAMTCSVAHASICGYDDQYCLAQS